MKVVKKGGTDGRVKIEAEVSAAEVNKALDSAAVMFAQQMGLRPQSDKTVAQAVQEKLGIKDLDTTVQTQAIEYLVPFAIDKCDLVPACPAKTQASSAMKRNQSFCFELEVMPKPAYELKSYEPVEIDVPTFEPDLSEVENQLKQLAEGNTEYVRDDDAKGPLGKGDSCLLALDCRQDGKPQTKLSTDGRTYTVGEGLMPDGFDENIAGMKLGEVKTFTFEGPGVDEKGEEITEVIECTATVREIQKKVVPVIDDEWVSRNMPMCANLEALRREIGESVERQQREQYEGYISQIAVAKLAERFEGSIADEIYEATMKNLMSSLRSQLRQQNIDYDTYVQQQGGEQQFNMMMMMQTRQKLIQGYSLDALFRHEKMAVRDADIDKACRSLNPKNPRAARSQMEQLGCGFVLGEIAERQHARDWLVEHAVKHEISPEAKE